jgi:hypothetical protein
MTATTTTIKIANDALANALQLNMWSNHRQHQYDNGTGCTHGMPEKQRHGERNVPSSNKTDNQAEGHHGRPQPVRHAERNVK